MTQHINEGRTLADMAIENFGSWEAITEIAKRNNVSMTDIPQAGTVLVMPEAVFDRMMEDYCRKNGVSPATARDTVELHMGIFSTEFTKEFR